MTSRSSAIFRRSAAFPSTSAKGLWIGYVARVHNMPKDLVVQRAAGAAKKMSDNQDAREAELIQNSKRDEIARIIIDSL